MNAGASFGPSVNAVALFCQHPINSRRPVGLYGLPTRLTNVTVCASADQPAFCGLLNAAHPAEPAVNVFRTRCCASVRGCLGIVRGRIIKPNALP